MSLDHTTCFEKANMKWKYCISCLLLQETIRKQMTSARIVCYSITIHVLNKPVFFLKCLNEATHGVLFLTLFFLLLTREVVSASSTRSLRRTTSSSCTNTRVTAWPAVEPVGEHVYKTLFLYFVRSSHKPVRRLPFKTDMVGNM